MGEDLFLAGAATAESVVGKMGPKGKVIVSSVAIGAIWSRKRQDGVMSVLNKYPDIKIVDTVNAEGDEQSAYAALENSFIAHPDVTGHISFGGTDYLWGRLMENKKVGNADSKKPIWSSGHDLYEEKLIQIKNGWTTTAYGQNPYKQGYEAVKQLYEFLTKGTAADGHRHRHRRGEPARTWTSGCRRSRTGSRSADRHRALPGIMPGAGLAAGPDSNTGRQAMGNPRFPLRPGAPCASAVQGEGDSGSSPRWCS